MIGSVKNALRKVLNGHLVSVFELQNLVCEIEGILNSRPLTPISDVCSDVLTPAHLLGYSPNLGLPPFDGREEDPDFLPPREAQKSQKFVDFWQREQMSADRFWSIWSTEYLLNLRELHARSANPKKDGESSFGCPKVGTVVLVRDSTPRSQWKLGRISELIVGGDGVARSARVLMPNHKTLLRAVKHLVPLEVPGGE